MITAEYAITRCRRDLTLSAMLRALMVALVCASLLVGPFVGSGSLGVMVLLAVACVWFPLSMRSMRASRLAADSTTLIAQGQFDAAEQNIGAAIRSFSLFRGAKLLTLHHLAVLRHAQNRWQDAAVLCRALLREGRRTPQGLGQHSTLILIDSLLEMNDLAGAGDAIRKLYDARLSLAEAMNLLLLQLDYESRIGAWDAMLQGIKHKLDLAEIMPGMKSARLQALLALAAQKCRNGNLSTWLRRRAELLADTAELCARPSTTYGTLDELTMFERQTDMEVRMNSKPLLLFGFTVTVAMVVTGLWAWSAAMDVAAHATRPDVIFWSMRSGAVALMTGGQAVLLGLVVNAIYGRRALGEITQIMCAVVCGVSLISAIALGLAGK